MHKHPELTLQRIAQLIKQISRQTLDEGVPLKLAFCSEPHETRRRAARGRFRPVAPGFRWGPIYAHAWFRADGRVPAAWAGSTVTAELELGGERTVWDEERPVWGLDPQHPRYRVARPARGGEPVRLYVEAYGINADVATSGRMVPPGPRPFRVERALLHRFDEPLWQLLLDLEFALGLLRARPAGEAGREHLLRSLNQIANELDPARRASIERARGELARTWGSLARDSLHRLTPVGHAHLDTAWLWPLGTTRLKMAHTTATQLALMDEYPEHHFVHSQALQYQWLEDHYPALFEEVRRRIRAGQWEPVGAMWVEADTNLSGGEALVRQILYGKRYLRSRFGVDVRTLWLPDAFGYSAALPQILRRGGIDAFLTQKLTWNQFNRFPHTTFVWQGIDGSRVFTHFPPAGTYNGDAGPAELHRHLTENRDAGRCDRGLYLYGHGDGGGGPTAEHLELLRRAGAAGGLPVVEWQPAAAFFDRARQESRDLEVWVGELYFELHRGTYTSQARVKQHNRRCEQLLRDLELLAAFDPGYPRSHPTDEIESLWKRTLTSQFHDILPGSSVREVYAEAERDYASVEARAAALIEDHLARIGGALSQAGLRGPLALFQDAEGPAEGQLPWRGHQAPGSIRCGAEQLPVQAVRGLEGERLILFPVPRAAQRSVALAELGTQPVAGPARLRARPRLLESALWSVRFDGHGAIRSLRSREDGVELVSEGKLGNVFQLFEDRPLAWSAWDLDIFSLETCRELRTSERFEVVERGPVRVAVELEKRFGRSRLVQRISLGPTPGIRFDTLVDWEEEERLLKVAFPLRLNVSRATFEIQFGTLERPTHRDTSWDLARFEVCAHRFVDLSEGGRGVALLNDGKYGHDVEGSTVRLSLLRSPRAPDPEADRGRHRFTYVLLPHPGGLRTGAVVAAAEALNSPLRVARPHPSRRARTSGGSGSSSATGPLLRWDDPNLVLDAVKRAEDGEDLVVRLHETHNCRGRARLCCCRPVRAALRCDLMEQPVGELRLEKGAVVIDYQPFEIITVRISEGRPSGA